MDSTLHGTSAAFLKHVTQTRLRTIALFSSASVYQSALPVFILTVS